METTGLNRLILIAAMVLLACAQDLWAFSFGGIEIKSRFGERFEAEIELSADEGGEPDVFIGEEEDYKKLELNRQRIVDELEVQYPLEVRGKKRIVHIRSKRPLFYPSFHLVMRASRGEGTVLESYLVTVDFQQTVALNVRGPKKKEKEPEKQPPRREADLVKGGEALPQSAKVKTPPRRTPDKTPVISAKTPATLVGQKKARRFLSGESKIAPRILPQVAQPPPVQPVRQAEKKSSQVAKRVSPDRASPGSSRVVHEKSAAMFDYGPLKRGDSLYKITRELGFGSAEANRAAVAIWLDNQEQFMNGNMHGVQWGVRLDLSKLKKRMAELDDRTAKDILFSQWREWKLIRRKLASAVDTEPREWVPEVPLPSEMTRQKLKVFDLLKAWKASWEAGELGRHLSYFSDREGEGAKNLFEKIKRAKIKMFQKHHNVRIRVHPALLHHWFGRPLVVFDQQFFSDKMESLGRKEIELVWEDEAWKIRRERFKARQVEDKRAPSPLPVSGPVGVDLTSPSAQGRPYVIHISSHAELSAATGAVNRLRGEGFDAYTLPIHITPGRKIYRVFIGRFSDLDLAKGWTRKLRGRAGSRYAIPVHYPYALQEGEYYSEEEAAQALQDLRGRGLSPFLMTSSEGDFAHPSFRVLLGAFAKKEDAALWSRALSGRGLALSLVEP